jgi:peptide/nickel transport system permease protein
MDQSIQRALEEALKLVKVRQNREATAVLAQVLASDPNNEQAWHMLSYALTDPDQQVYALQRVLHINPDNGPARKRLEQLGVSAPPPVPAQVPPPEPPAQPEPVPVMPQPDSSEPESAPALTPSTHDVPEPTPTVMLPTPAEPEPAPTVILPTQAESESAATGPQPTRLASGLALADKQAPPSSSAFEFVPAPQPPAQQSPRPAATPAAWAANPTLTGAAAVAARPFPFPGTAEMPEVKYGRWHRLNIRARLAWRRFRMDWAVFSQSRFAVLGVIIILLFALMAIAHPILIRTVWPKGIYGPVTGFDMSIFPHPSPPVKGHLLGTDTLGRDVLSMLLAATTPTFAVGLTAALASAFVGTLMSVVAAYFRGPADTLISNLADVFLLFPAPVIMVIIGARFRDLGPVHLGLIYGCVTGAGPTAIIMRSHAIQTMARPYMEAAQISGGGAIHIIVKHLLPAMLPLAALQMMIAVTGAVVADGFISFFGLTRTSSNWGTLIYNAFVYNQISSSGGPMWNMLLPAALCFSLFAMGFYLVSRGLHRVASPTIREEPASV